MRKLLSFMIMVAMLATSLIISGCLPPNFSEEKASKIAKEHKQEAFDWFAKNRPEVQVDKECKAYANGTNLYSAVEGKYKHKGQTYEYIYEYKDKAMYISEGYEETCRLLEDRVLADYGLTKENAKLSFHGYNFRVHDENDKAKQGQLVDAKTGAFLSGPQKKIPALKTPAEFAQMTLDPQSRDFIRLFLASYREDFSPLPGREKAVYKDMLPFRTTTVIDFENKPQGLFEEVIRGKDSSRKYYHLEKLAEGFYGGYIASVQPKEDKVKFTIKDGKSFTMELPQNTQPIFFSKKAVKLKHCFTNKSGKAIENLADSQYRKDKTMLKGCYEFSSGLFVRDSFKYCYKNISVPLVGGVYEYTIISGLDLD